LHGPSLSKFGAAGIAPSPTFIRRWGGGSVVLVPIAPSLPHRIALAAALGLAATALAACSLIIEHRDRQCSTDADCKGFEGARCDTKQGICVGKPGPDGGGGADAGCVGPSGCWACTPTTTHEHQTACTDAACEPYDNAPLAPLLSSDGGLPAIP
jgi:hypothetical protein